jgi:hypothetical protein
MVMFNSLPAALGLFTAAEIRALAVTIAVRAPYHPVILTIDEFEPSSAASQNTRSRIAEVLNKETNRVLADQKLKDEACDPGPHDASRRTR